jgi:hypothetical protein
VSGIATGVAINDLLATRLYLDGQWNLDEFELLFRQFNDLYRLIAEFTVKAGSVNSFVRVPVPFHRGRLNRVAREQGIPALRVLRFNYSSPGHIDLLGLGRVAEVTKDTLFGIADRITSREDRELDRDRKLIENQVLQAKTARETADATLKRAQDGELHTLAVEEKKITNERARVALTSERLEAAAKGLAIFNGINDLARESGASKDDISNMSAGFIAKVEPIVRMILEGKLLAEPSMKEPKSLPK